MSSRIQPLLPGDPRRIGAWRVIGRLGSGGMGAVFAVVDPAGLRLAVKVIHPAHAANDEFRARFRREVRLSRRVTGPCLVPVHDADTDGTTPWLAAPFVPGPTLVQYLDAHGPVQGAPLYALAAGTAAALAAVHGAGIVHRDIKPGNVILSPSGPKVLDFGISHALDGTSVTRTGVVTGSPGWISPEHYQTGVVGPEGDVFAWGALVAYAATGRLPFGSGAPDAVAFRIMSAEPDLSGLPGDLLPMVEQALAKQPGNRPTGAELARACSTLLAAQATAVTPASEQPTLAFDLASVPWDVSHEDDPAWRSAGSRRKRPGVVAAAAVAALVAGTIGGAVTVKASGMPGQAPTAAPSNSPRAVAPSAQPSAQEVRRPSTSPTPSAAAAPSSSAPAEEPEPSASVSLQPPPFAYLPTEVDCAPRKPAEVDGAWQIVAPGEVRAGDAVELSLRNKYGNFDPIQPEMDVLARVYVPD
ncbi:serine/threonine-protein kinase [Streptomyces solicathayae]|uniref:Serine/threonine-protein kinase n=1 Tax=Streptomyces solicathayae TaxID=3081768 RepID=A0ABZ0LK61_9ACTN|nr:serine/threonine-protein kinase [Streptomyces sp. HUAS YS2]WOX19886.1 serine/threonine-protein kinase [Streptomyces sp. HUAS YS2]WOX26493.1 serine/threonine-protein kinase [Streptomyces sp. HUAS YS2]